MVACLCSMITRCRPTCTDSMCKLLVCNVFGLDPGGVSVYTLYTLIRLTGTSTETSGRRDTFSRVWLFTCGYLNLGVIGPMCMSPSADPRIKKNMPYLYSVALLLPPCCTQTMLKQIFSIQPFCACRKWFITIL